MTPSDARPALEQGMTFDASDPERLAAALDAALDYRGDVTLLLRDGRTLEGYVFDRRRGARPGLRLLARDAARPEAIDDDTIAELRISGKDTAAGKTFENWVRRWAERKRAGERASIESESLD